MRADLLLLCFGYVLSQFFRAFLAVLAQVLGDDIGVTPENLATASGLWFLIFAAMQIPVGAALDRVGPRRTAAVLLFLGGGGGALLFSLATNAFHINIAMALIGIGCSPILMASYYIFARSFPASQFATLAAVMLGVGSVGNLVASYPMAWAAEAIGWRMSLMVLAGVSMITALGLGIMVKDPPRVEHDEKGSVLDLLKMPVLWAIFPIMLVAYAPAGAIRGLWLGPYLGDVFGWGTTAIGSASLVMGCAMIAGTLIYGPLDRLLGTRKWVIFGGNFAAATICIFLATQVEASATTAIICMSLIGFFGATFPIILAHGRSFCPPHLTGRGVTLLNLFGVGGVGVLQFVSGPLHSSYAAQDPTTGYAVLFAFFGGLLIFGLVIYLFSRDSIE